MTADDSADLLTLHQAADQLGCHYMTVYRRVRSGELEAALCGGSYRVRRDALERWLAQRPARAGACPTRAARPRDWPAHAVAFHDLLVAGDGPGSLRCIARLVENGADALEVCERVVRPAMVQIGDEWAAGRSSEAEEHRATAIVEMILARLAPAFSKPGPRRGVAIVATPTGERHALPAALVACALRGDRWTVHYLGADLPAPSIAATARAERAAAAVLSCTLETARPALAATITALRGAGVAVLVGGAALDAGLAAELGADAYAGSLGEAQTALRALAGRAPAAADPA